MFKFRTLLLTSRRFSTVANKVKQLQSDYSNITPKILDLVDRRLLFVPNHPLQILKKSIQSYFLNQAPTKTFQAIKPNYNIIDKLEPIVSTAMNFDSLAVPQDHVSRKRSDTYYINRETVLRTHTSAHQVTTMSQNIREFILFGDVYRRDEVDQYHYPVFHQMEAVRIFNKKDFINTQHDVMIMQTANDLKETLEGLVKHLFGDIQMRWVEAYFPFTHPSFELEILYEGKWLEMLGCGVIHPQILKNSNIDNGEVGWAAGLGLERFAMKLFNIPDVRLFWSEDSRFLEQFKDGKIIKYKPFSKYPVCIKDISFWLNDPETFEENDVHSTIREIGGDLVEKVECVDTFVDSKKGRTSKCYRISFRSLERTLLNDEIDRYQFQMRDELSKKLNIVLR